MPTGGGEQGGAGAQHMRLRQLDLLLAEGALDLGAAADQCTPLPCPIDCL